MARTFIRQDTQIRNSDVYDDSVAPTEAAYETNPTHIETDLNNMRSQVQNFLNRDGASFPTGNWWDDLTAPSTLETGTQRGINSLNDALHAVEKKRVLTCTWGLNSISIASAGDTFDILGTGELPGNTTAAVGAVTTLGTVVAAHGGTFGTASLDEVAGPTAISPKNLVQIVDATTRDPILDAGNQIYGLLQSEDATDGHTITDTTTTRVQISFVKLNGAGTDLVAITSGAMDGISYDYCYVERVRLEDLNESNFLGGANIDVPAGSTVNRQVSYDNQGTTPVDLTTNATLDLEGAGLTWAIRDDLEANLFTIVEGSAGGTSQVNIHADVDEFDVDAAVNNFAEGVTVDSAGTALNLGVTAGQIDMASSLTIAATGGTSDIFMSAGNELYFDDTNQTGSTWAQTAGIKLSETTAEWDNFETQFGEVSLLNAIVQAGTAAARTKGVAVVTTNAAADVNVTGAGGTPNLDAQLPDYSGVTFLTDVDVYLNGVLLRNGADASANHDVYPGDSPANGDLKFEFQVKSTGSTPDVITMIVYGG